MQSGDGFLKRVLFAGGGTGGHLYPGLTLAERLRAEGVDVHFFGSRRGVEVEIVPRFGFPLHLVKAGRLSRKPVQALVGVLETAVGFLQCLGFLLRHRPDLIVGTGGYASAPVALAGAVLGVKLMVLEQNAVPGKVTRLLARFARHVCVSFPESTRWLPGKRTLVTGNPVRAEILACTQAEGRKRLGLAPERPCLLVTGASQGAVSLNRAVLRSLPRWSERAWSVLHLTGPKHLEEVERERSATSRLDYRPLGYLDDMAAAYAAADLVVCRAGATTLAEVTARGLPAILVPYPFAAEDHQRLNARAAVKSGAAELLEDDQVEAGLAGLVEELLGASDRLTRMAAASRALGKPAATEEILGLVHALVGDGKETRDD